MKRILFFSIMIVTVFVANSDLFSLYNPRPIGYTPPCADGTFCGRPLEWFEDTLFVTPPNCPTCEVKVIFRYAMDMCMTTQQFYFGSSIWDIVIPTECHDCSNYTFEDLQILAMKAFYEVFVRENLSGWKRIFPNAEGGMARFTSVGCKRVYVEGPDGTFTPYDTPLYDPLDEELVGSSSYIRLQPSKHGGPQLQATGCGNICCKYTCYIDEDTDDYIWDYDFWGDCDQTGSGSNTYYCTALCDKYQTMLNEGYSGTGQYDDYSHRKVTSGNLQASTKFTLSPNPANDKIVINVENQEGYIFDIKIFNNNGMNILNTSFSNSSIELNTSSYMNGIYYVVIYQEGNPLYMEKLIINK